MAARSSRRPRPSRPRRWRSSRCGPMPRRRRSSCAERIAGYAPGDLNRVFFTTGGGEAVESAWKLAKNYFKLTGKPGKYKVISRSIAYHGTPQGALAITGLPVFKAPFEPLTPGGFRVPNTNFYRAPATFEHDIKAFGQYCADRIAEAIEFEGPDTVAAVFLEPVQNAGGCFPPPPRVFRAGPRDLRRVRRAAGVRRGDLRLRPHRFDVRLRRLRLCARHHHLRKGFDVGLLADRRDDRQRPAVRAVQRRQDHVRARLHVRRASGVVGGGAGQPRHLRARGHSTTTSRRTRRRSAPPWRSSTTCRSSATSAAKASSTASNWSRTRPPRRRSTTRRASGCCAAS